MQKKISIAIASIAVLLMACAPLVSHAAIYVGQNNYTLPAEERSEGNVYAGGNSITVNGTVGGDLIAGGSTITLNGVLEDDVIVAGGSISIGGELQDDLRAAGATIVLTGTVAGDVNVAGSDVTIAQNAIVRGDVVVAAGRLTVDGTIEGNLGASVETLTVSGVVQKNIEAKLTNLTLTSSAVVEGDVSYEGPNKATIEDGATITGDTIFTEKRVDRFGKYFGVVGLSIAAFFANVVGTLILALVLVSLFAMFSQKIVASANENFWKTFLIGLLVLIVMPVLGVLLFVTLIGIPLAVMLFVIYMMLIMVGGVYASILAGAYLVKLFQKSSRMEATWKTALLGVIVLQAVMLVPFIGWLIGLVFFLAGLGAFSSTLFRTLGNK